MSDKKSIEISRKDFFADTPFTLALLDALEGSVALFDGSGAVVGVNSAWRELQKIHSDNAHDLGPIQEAVRAIVTGEQDFHRFEYSCPVSTREQWFSVSAAVIPFDEQRFVLVTRKDITGEKKNRRELDDIREHYELLDKNVTDMISVHAPDGTYLFTSHSSEALLGYKQEELLGRNAYDFFYPEDLQAVQESHSRILQEQIVFTVEYRIRRKDGRYLWVETTSKTVIDNSNGTVQKIIAVTRDISARKKTERELQKHKKYLEQMVDQRTGELRIEIEERIGIEKALRESKETLNAFLANIPLAAYIKDTDGKYLVVNHQFAQISGYEFDSIIGKTDFDLFPNEIAEEFTKNDGEVITHRKAVQREEKFIFNGVEQVNLSVKFPLQRDDGLVYAVAGISMDVTDRKLLITRLSQAKEEAEAANRTKSEFLSNVTHELRTPLNPIINLADILLDTELDSEQREFITDIKNAAEKLFGMVTDLIEISRMEAGDLTISAGPFNLQELIVSIRDRLEKKIGKKPIETKARIEADVPDVVVGDVAILKEVLSKLAENAVKFTEKGEIGIIVAVEKQEAEKVWLQFSFYDTGIGIPEDQLGSLFNDFTQADGSSKRRFEGIGLGLTKARRLISALHGTLRPESIQGQGTTFSFTIPFELYK